MQTYRSVESRDDDSRYPREILSNNESYFDLLFDVLAVSDDTVVSDAWALLQMLPTNERIQRAVHGVLSSSAAVDWAALFSPASPLKLLYALEIVEKVVGGDDALVPGKEWGDAFVAKGGLAHLIRVLLACNVDGWLASMLPKSCLTLVMKMVQHFIAASPASLSALDAAEIDSLLTRIVRVVGAAITSSKDLVRGAVKSCVLQCVTVALGALLSCRSCATWTTTAASSSLRTRARLRCPRARLRARLLPPALLLRAQARRT
jgi:hypothetical protein